MRWAVPATTKVPIGFCILLACGLVAVWVFGSQSVGAQNEVVKIEPTAMIGLQALLPESVRYQQGKLQVHGFAAGNNALAFLIAAGPVGRMMTPMIVRVSGQGEYTGHIALPRERVLDMDIDSGGNLYVLRSGRLDVYDVANTLTNVIEFADIQDQPRLICASGSTVLGYWMDTGIVGTVAPGVTGVSANVGRADARVADLVCLSSGKFALVKGVAATVTMGELIRGKSEAFEPTGSEISNARVAYEIADQDVPAAQRGISVIMPSAAASPQGKIYARISGGTSLKEGSVILEISPEGNVVRSLRCTLPKFDELRVPGNPEGYMTGSYVGADINNLYVVSRDGRIAVFAI